MPTSRTKTDGKFPGELPVNALAYLKEEQPKAVIGRRLRTMAPKQRQKVKLSSRQQKALCAEDHNPQLETACDLAKADPVIRAKIIVDCLPEDLALKVAHLRWDDFDDQIEFHRIVCKAISGPLE